MDQVYGNSTITLASDRVTTSSAGFLGDRTPRTYATIPFCRDHLSGKLLLFLIDTKLFLDAHYSRLQDKPLTARGWALQE